MTAPEVYLVDCDDLSRAETAEIGRAVLGVVHPRAAKFETDIPGLTSDDPPEIHAAADVLRVAAGKTSAADLQYAMTGWLDANDQELWNAYATFMPWSFDGAVVDYEGHQIVSVDDGVVSFVAVAQDQLPELADAVPPERLRLWHKWRADRRAALRRRLSRHPDTVIGCAAVALGLLLMPLPGPGLRIAMTGFVILLVGSLIRLLRGRPHLTGADL